MVSIQFGQGQSAAVLLTDKLNRHGIIAGATGTGKTVTLKVLAEKLSEQGIPVFLSDIKGDLSSLMQPGEMTDDLQARLNQLGVTDFEPTAYPVEFWDVLGQAGLPVRTTISEMGPILLSQLLGLNDTQEGILNIAFKLADDEQLLLIDLKDLRAMLNYVGERASELRALYGNITQQSIGAILRSLLVLEQQGGDRFFGEPACEIADLIRTDATGRGIINILASEKLFQTPKLYATFLLWFLSELYETLPEVGDLDKPKLVFFFDEAHVLFSNANPAVLEKIELIVRLIRSKGVGVFFVTQNPTDIPDSVGSQLGNRIQHGLRAFTPKEQKTVKAVAETFRQSPNQKLDEVITQLQVGQAVSSTMLADGSPSFADVVTIFPPRSSLVAIDPLLRQQTLNQSVFYDKYAEAVDSHSAYEQLVQTPPPASVQVEPVSLGDSQPTRTQEPKSTPKQSKAPKIEATKAPKTTKAPVSRRTDSNFDRFTKNLMSSVGREVGKTISRGILGMLKK